MKDQSVYEQAYCDVRQSNDAYMLQRFEREAHEQQIEFLYDGPNAFARSQLIDGGTM